MKTQFHISLPSLHIEATRKFYQEILGATVGRNTEKWVDINLYEHQLTFANSGKFSFNYPHYSFDKVVLPSFHFGIILTRNPWEELYLNLKTANFLHIDQTRFLENKVGTHVSFFLKDPNGYVIEFKCFEDPVAVFHSSDL